MGCLQAVADGVMAFASYQKRPPGMDKKSLAKQGVEITKVLVCAVQCCKTRVSICGGTDHLVALGRVGTKQVPGTKTRTVWVLTSADDEKVDKQAAAALCWAAVKATTLGPYQQHMCRCDPRLRRQCHRSCQMLLAALCSTRAVCVLSSCLPVSVTHRCTQLTKTPCSTDKSAPPPPSSYRLELAQCNNHVGVALLRTFIDSYLFDLVRPSLSLATATVSQRSKRASGSGLPMPPPPPCSFVVLIAL
jgi:hypothetical protein